MTGCVGSPKGAAEFAVITGYAGGRDGAAAAVVTTGCVGGHDGGATTAVTTGCGGGNTGVCFWAPYSERSPCTITGPLRIKMSNSRSIMLPSSEFLIKV